jgi:small subunit ribosomal protein S2
MQITFEQRLRAGRHLGHQTRKWNPKRAGYTYGVRKGLYLIDLVKSRQKLVEARKYLAAQAAEGKTFLFIGTKTQAAHPVQEAAQRCKAFYVTERWLGGRLTNWRTVRSSLVRLHLLERQEKRGDLEKLPKKEAATLRQLKERLTHYVGGLKGRRRPPDVAIIVGQQQELAAVAECRRLGIPRVTLLDTDCNPTLTEVGVPTNDDSSTAIELVVREFAAAIREGRRLWRTQGAARRTKGKRGVKSYRPAKRTSGRRPVRG